MNPYGDGAGFEHVKLLRLIMTRSFSPAKLITDQYLSDLRLTRSLAWASYSVLVYDYLITFNDEVQLIWKANPSRVKNIFLANRYGNLILQGIMSAQTGGVFWDDAISFCFSLTLVAGISMFLSYASIHDRASLALSRDERGGQMPGEEYVPPNSPIMFDLNMIPMISKDTALDEEVGSHTVPDEK